jgi:dTDP-4-amino-4,6-dideoxygalactose transaminase
VEKTHVDELALFGGQPAFVQSLHVGRPNIGNRQEFLALVNDMLDRRWFTNDGPFVQELERQVATMLGVRHCVAVCNATIALDLTARALGLTGEVILPSFTFVASAHALQWQGITPVFCDVDPQTHNIDPAKIPSLITARTTGILGVHVWGRACDVERLAAIARQHQLKLMFDAAHAFGCSYNGRMIGGFGDAEVFSFHATKFFNTFEGGAVTTNSDELADKLRGMRNFGFAGIDDVAQLGTNGKMSEISAAMGLTSLPSLDALIAANHSNYLAYSRDLDHLRGIRLVRYDKEDKSNYQYIVAEIDEQEARISRDLLVRILHAENVLARRYFYPGCHQMEPYRSLFPDAGLALPESERLTQKVFQLPTGTAVAEVDIHRICGVIRFVLANAAEIRARMEA